MFVMTVWLPLNHCWKSKSGWRPILIFSWSPFRRTEFIDRGRPVVEVPFDPHLRPGGVVDVSNEMALATRRKFLEVTATITGYFAAQPERGRDRRPGDDKS